MAVKIGIVDVDSSFVKRFASLMNAKFEDFEVLVFPNLKSAQTAATKVGLDLLFIDYSVAKRNNLNNSFQNLIPEQCKLALLTTEKEPDPNEIFPVVCKYKSLEEWKEVICHFCMDKNPKSSLGGSASGVSLTHVCLFVSFGSGVGASAVASDFANYFYEKGKEAIVLEPFSLNGEQIVNYVSSFDDSLYIFLNLSTSDENSIVLPFMNADAVIFLSDGKAETNKEICELLEKLPMTTELSNLEIQKKSFLLYSNFEKGKGELLKEKDLLKLGGFDTEENREAALSKLERFLCSKK